MNSPPVDGVRVEARERSTSASERDQCVVEAAQCIEAALELLTAPRRQTVERGLCAFPGSVPDPRRPEPVRYEAHPYRGRVHESLNAYMAHLDGSMLFCYPSDAEAVIQMLAQPAPA